MAQLLYPLLLEALILLFFSKSANGQLGETIGEISQQRGKVNLDKGALRQLVADGKIPSVAAFSTPAAELSFQPSEKPSQEETVSSRTPSPIKASPFSDESLAEDIGSTEASEDTGEFHTGDESLDVPIFTGQSQSIESPAQQESKTTSLSERLNEALKSAMRAQEKIPRETVRSLKKALLEKEIALRPTGQQALTPDQELEVLAQQAKQRRESIEQYRQAGREDLAQKEAQELAIIETYLPQQLTEAELGEILAEIIASLGATSPHEMGKVMAVAMQQLKGRADGKKIQEIVKSQLNQ
ncbi:MAG: GatB/YqeY domain-containing protein [Microcystaceae cyanobacterium]